MYSPRGIINEQVLEGKLSRNQMPFRNWNGLFIIGAFDIHLLYVNRLPNVASKCNIWSLFRSLCAVIIHDEAALHISQPHELLGISTKLASPALRAGFVD